MEAASATPGHGGGALGGGREVAATPDAGSPVSLMPELASWLEALLLLPVLP